MKCRLCGADCTAPMISLGNQYLSDFRADSTRPPRYPLNLVMCQDCSLVQLDTTVPREVLYTDAYGFASGVNENNRADLTNIVHHAFRHQPFAQSWLDIACNDGTLLSNVPASIFRTGVDPVEKFAEQSRQHADVIIPDFFDPSAFSTRSFDVVTAISMFYDIDYIDRFVSGLEHVLAENGILVIQQNYAVMMLESLAIDNICHEHITYFTLATMERALARHQLEVIDVALSPVNGGALRTVIARAGERSILPTVSRQRLAETRSRVSDPETWSAFADSVSEQLTALRRLVRGMAERGEQVYAYGAGTRGSVLMQAAGLGASEVPCAVERQAGKVGKFWSAVGIPIISEDAPSQTDPPAALLVLPWWNRAQVIEREAAYLDQGGSLIFPLPKLDKYTR